METEDSVETENSELSQSKSDDIVELEIEADDSNNVSHIDSFTMKNSEVSQSNSDNIVAELTIETDDSNDISKTESFTIKCSEDSQSISEDVVELSIESGDSNNVSHSDSFTMKGSEVSQLESDEIVAELPVKADDSNVSHTDSFTKKSSEFNVPEDKNSEQNVTSIPVPVPIIKKEPSEQYSNDHISVEISETLSNVDGKTNSTNGSTMLTVTSTTEANMHPEPSIFLGRKGNGKGKKRKAEEKMVSSRDTQIVKRGKMKKVQAVEEDKSMLKGEDKKHSINNKNVGRKSLIGKRKNQEKIDLEQVELKKPRLGKKIIAETKSVEAKKVVKKVVLGDLPGLKERLQKEDKSGLRPLHRLLFNCWPLNDAKQTMSSILRFGGFGFPESHTLYKKKKTFLEKLSSDEVHQISDLLGMRRAGKPKAVESLLKFLVKPTEKLDPEMDAVMQPYVKIERLSIPRPTTKAARKRANTRNEASKAKKEVSPKSKAIQPKKESKVAAMEVAEVLPKNKGMAVKPKKVPEVSPRNKGIAIKAKKVLLKNKVAQPKEVTPKKPKEEALPKSKAETVDTPHNTRGKSSRRGSILSKSKKKEQPQLKQKDIPPIVTLDDSPTKKASPSATAKMLPETGGKTIAGSILSELSFMENTSSEETLSSEEAASESHKVVRKVVRGRALSSFPKITESIKKANCNALQRLHILLFGASEDKPESLKSHILAFGGFPFESGSNEWKEKKFLLSLLALNTLREYLNVLCLEYGDDSHSELISKLMNFLVAPTEKMIELCNKNAATMGEVGKQPEMLLTEHCLTLAENEPVEVETKVISSELINTSIAAKARSSRTATKKKEKKPSVRRKVLMDLEQVKRLEADIAREQRILLREKHLREDEAKQNIANLQAISGSRTPASRTPSTKPKKVVPKPTPQYIRPTGSVQPTDKKQLEALLQTVYQRRALKASGATLSLPDKGVKLKLENVPNVKFMVVTGKYQDLDILHHLIYMFDATKSRVRKNILDFDGFGFGEDSEKYHKRMDFLKSLGYDISKRMAFLLGLAAFDTDIAQQDLNELIMYFLMAPTQIDQVPIRRMPQDYYSNATWDKKSVLVMSQQAVDPNALLENNAITQRRLSVPKEVAKKKVVPPMPQLRTPVPIARPMVLAPTFISPQRMFVTPPTSLLPSGIILFKPPENRSNGACVEKPPPTDEELYSSIQDIMHNSNYEHMTLQDVINRVSEKYSYSDLTHRRNFMKDCIKKVIMGT